jgi:hypothetical protein
MRASHLILLALVLLPSLAEAQPPPWPNGVSTPMGIIPPNGVYMVTVTQRVEGGTMDVALGGRTVHARPIRMLTTPSHTRVLQAVDASNQHYTFSIGYRMRECPSPAMLMVDGHGIALANDTPEPDCTYVFEGIDAAMATHIGRVFGARRRDFSSHATLMERFPRERTVFRRREPIEPV